MKLGKGDIAVITGASSGIGSAMARELSRRGAFVILSGRNEKALELLADELGHDKAVVIPADLGTTEGCKRLYSESLMYSPNILINNAGFGIYGLFSETDADRETQLIDLDVRAVHIMSKLYGDAFERQGGGYILNVGSLAGFMPGPLMSSYYAAKAYVIRHTQAVWLEKLFTGSKVRVSVLCPGPVQTPFNERAGIRGSIKGISPEQCAREAVKGMELGLPMIFPSASAKAVAVGSFFAPALISGAAAYFMQRASKKRV